MVCVKWFLIMKPLAYLRSSVHMQQDKIASEWLYAWSCVCAYTLVRKVCAIAYSCMCALFGHGLGERLKWTATQDPASESVGSQCPGLGSEGLTESGWLRRPVYSFRWNCTFGGIWNPHEFGSWYILGIYQAYFFPIDTPGIYLVYILIMYFKINHVLINLNRCVSLMSNYDIHHNSVLEWRLMSNKIHGVKKTVIYLV